MKQNTLWNIDNVSLWYSVPPFIVLLSLMLFPLLTTVGGGYERQYIQIQIEAFLYLNEMLSKYAELQKNLTQLGDALILFPLLGLFTIYAPKIWEALISSALITLGVTAVLKRIFNIPRPLEILDVNFTIIGEGLVGYSSMPSGHSITIFMVLTILLFWFSPKKLLHKIAWVFLITATGVLIAFSRVAVGAHFPIDVISGCLIGFILAIIGIKLSTKLNWLNRLAPNYEKTIVLKVILLIWMILLLVKIRSENLVIYYISLLSLLLTFGLTFKKL